MPSPQLETILGMLRVRPRRDTLDPIQARAEMEQAAGVLPLPSGVDFQGADAGSVAAEWSVADGISGSRHLLYLHGGGYVIGSPRTHRGLTGRLSRACDARVLSVDYRLAPEHPHPAAVEDATAAYRWLLDRGAEPSRTAIAGDSAGGGLTVATLVALRDAGEPLPAAGVCLSPWVDLEGIGESMTTRADVDPMVERKGLLQMAVAYLGGADPRTPLAAPLYADLSGLPPLLIQVGTAETLLDDATRLAEKARGSGVEATLEPWEEMIHVWHFFAGILPEGDEAIGRIGEFVRKHAS